MRNVNDCNKIKKRRNESEDVYLLKVLLCKLGKHLGFEVDVEEGQESELGKLAIRHYGTLKTQNGSKTCSR